MGLNFIKETLEAVARYAALSWKDWVFIWMLSIVSELIALAGMLLVARALAVPLTLFNLGWMRSLFFLAALIPFTLVGGFGLREITVVAVLSALGIGREEAAAYALLLYARSLLVSLPGGAVELWSSISLRST